MNTITERVDLLRLEITRLEKQVQDLRTQARIYEHNLERLKARIKTKRESVLGDFGVRGMRERDYVAGMQAALYIASGLKAKGKKQPRKE